jgi:hypothetical protein
VIAAMLAFGLCQAPDESARPVRKPRDSWVLQFGLAHSSDDQDHYAVSGFQGRFALVALDRNTKSDKKGDLGVEVGLYPYPMISRAYVPGPNADPETPGKHNVWELAGVSYQSPPFGPLQLDAGVRLAFVNRAERVLTSPHGGGYVKESLKTLDTILFPSFRGERGVVSFVAASLLVKRVGLRLEWAKLNSGGARVNATGLRFGLTAR